MVNSGGSIDLNEQVKTLVRPSAKDYKLIERSRKKKKTEKEDVQRFPIAQNQGYSIMPNRAEEMSSKDIIIPADYKVNTLRGVSMISKTGSINEYTSQVSQVRFDTKDVEPEGNYDAVPLSRDNSLFRRYYNEDEMMFRNLSDIRSTKQ